jgi:transcriptional regulator with XRE-family HTH domain
MFEADHEVQAIDPEDCGSFAVRLFHARSSIPLTQEELAARAGTPGGSTAIGHYEAGRREPNLANLRRLIWATGSDADYLLATRPGVDDCYRDGGVAAERRPERRYTIKVVPPSSAPENVRAAAGDVEIVGTLYVLRVPEHSSQYERDKAAKVLESALKAAHADGSPFSWLVLPADWSLDACEAEPA